MIVTDFATDPYGGRVVLCLYGPQKIGKTSTILKMVAEQGQLLYIMSPDRGLFNIRGAEKSKLYAGRMMVSYPDGLRDIRNDLATMTERVKKAVGRVGAAKVWFVLDTVTELQDMLLAEARKIDVSNPNLGKNEKKAMSEDDVFLRDMTTQVDYFINMGHMSEVVQMVQAMPCNVIFTALAKTEKPDDKNRKKDRPRTWPKISASAYEKITGNADAILYMNMADEGTDRVLHCTPSSDFLAGDRSGNLAETEKPDLVAIRKKMLGITDEKMESPVASQAASAAAQ